MSNIYNQFRRLKYTKRKKEYADDYFRAFIKTSYKNEFINKYLDYEYEDIESYYYGCLMIYLQKTGEKEAKKAMEYFET